MSEVLRQATIILRGTWKYRWLGLLVASAVGAIGIVTIMFIPDKYEAAARIFVNTDSILKPLMAGMTVQPNDNRRIEMLSRIVISRPYVEKIVDSVGLDAEATSKEDRERLVDRVLKVLAIKETGNTNLYMLTFRDTVPERAKRVVELLASTFIESGQGNKISDTDAAKKFIDEQIVVYEKKLEEAENRLKAFKLRNLGVNAGEGKDYFGRMSELNTLLNQAELELRQAENSRDAFKRGLEKEEHDMAPTATAPSNTGGSIAEIEARIDALRRNLDTLLLKFTETHPDVVAARRVIKELEEQRRQLQLARKTGDAPATQSAASGPRAYDQLKVALAGAEANVGASRARVVEYSARLSRLKESAKLMPQIEAELAQINRDYEVNKKNYENLITRRESASMSSEMQSVSGVADFRVIDPPRVSPRPVAPNRVLLMSLSLVLALGAGFAGAFAAMELRPTCYDGRTLREVAGLPLLGVVSVIINDSMRRERRKGLIRFLMGTGAFLGVYVAGFAYLAVQSVLVA
jgi:polysaccharide chain length determinant protein (PEP-CTERM system associated)